MEIKFLLYKYLKIQEFKIIIPIRCFSCGKPIAHLWEEFKEKVSEGENPKKVFEELDVERYCCRAMFLGQEDYIELVSKFKKA